MTVLALDATRQRAALRFTHAARNRQITAVGGRARSLDAMLVGVWEDLTALRPAPCLVCGGVMGPQTGGAGGQCRDCGSLLT